MQRFGRSEWRITATWELTKNQEEKVISATDDISV